MGGQTELERIVALEVRVHQIEEKQEQAIEKLDQLLALRNKGMGAFWLASALVGTGFISLLFSFLDWLRGAQ